MYPFKFNLDSFLSEGIQYNFERTKRIVTSRGKSSPNGDFEIFWSKITIFSMTMVFENRSYHQNNRKNGEFLGIQVEKLLSSTKNLSEF